MRFLQNHPSLQILAKTYSSCVASLTTITTTTTTSCHHQHRQSKIIDHCRSGELLLAIQQLNSRRANAFSNLPLLYASLLQTCTKHVSFTTGLQLHALVLKSGLETNNFIGNSLLALYFKLGTDFCLTRKVFDGLPCKDVVSWTSMITGYVKEDKPMESIQLFYEMVDFGMDPNGFTLSAVIKASSDLCDLRLGRCFHGSAMVRGFDSNHVVISALIDMYGKNHCLDDARQLFDELLVPDPICWTAVISGLTREDMYNEALEFFYLMQKKHGFLPDAFTFGSVVTACGNLGRLKQGRELHGRVITSGFSGNVVVESSLVDMYGKCGLVDQSQLVFDKMNVKNSVSESALLGGYCQNGDFKSVLRLFKGMEVADLYHFGTVLRACAGLSAVREGKEIHCQYIRKAGWPWVIVESALVDLYAKCGCIDYAYRVFLKMPEKNLITWNSMVRGFAQNGRGEAALRIFDEMVMNGIRPDYISFIAVLFACIHSGLLDQGRKYFASMTKEYGIDPGIEHYNCMVDLLGRAGLFEEAEELIKDSDCRDDSSLWAVLLGACTTGTESTTTERIAKKTMELEPDYHLSYIYLANVYKAVGRWEDALKIRALMEERGVKKTAGKSWIEANSSLRMNLQT